MIILSQLLLVLVGATNAAPVKDPLVAVFVDAKTEAKLGAFPYDRKVYADAIGKLKDAGARAVVVKFFLDQAKTEAGDAALEAALKSVPCFLQARIDDTEKSPNELPARFAVAQASGSFAGVPTGRSGWIPIKRFADAAAGVGFVDLRSADEPFAIPLVERYRGAVVPSLYLSVLQRVFGGDLSATDAAVTIGKRTVRVDGHGEVAVKRAAPGPEVVSLLDLLEGRADPKLFAGRIVELGYDGDKQPQFKTPRGTLNAHRLFFYALADLYPRFAPK